MSLRQSQILSFYKWLWLSVILLAVSINPIVQSKTPYYFSRNPRHVTKFNDSEFNISKKIFMHTEIIVRRHAQSKWTHVSSNVVKCHPKRESSFALYRLLLRRSEGWRRNRPTLIYEFSQYDDIFISMYAPYWWSIPTKSATFYEIGPPE
jgi:hypothetical protein